MGEKQNNYAFIDSQNVNLAIRDQGGFLILNDLENILRINTASQMPLFLSDILILIRTYIHRCRKMGIFSFLSQP